MHLVISVSPMYALCMENSTAESYCADLVRQLAPDAFFEALFLPADRRAELLALYALDSELRHVHAAVSEEITAHIRYAWWQESLDQLHAGQPARAHPVVQAIAAAAQSGALTYEQLSGLVHHYRISYPAYPQQRELLDKMSESVVRCAAPSAFAMWQKARRCITAHRQRHGSKRQLWLILRLYLLGTGVLRA